MALSDRPSAPASAGTPLIYLIACEASGDQIGALLMQALQEQTGGRVKFAGLGGPMMARAGLISLFDVRDLALLGVFEVLPKARLVLRRVRETMSDIESHRPDILVTIDSWGFTGRIHERLTRQRSSIPRVRYVAPQVWAWRRGRAKQLARWINRCWRVGMTAAMAHVFAACTASPRKAKSSASCPAVAGAKSRACFRFSGKQLRA
jgi:hypothetical protein